LPDTKRHFMIINAIKYILKFFFHVCVKGNLNHLNHDKLIITSNHVSFLDGILLGIFLPVKPVFAIYSGYMDHWLIKLTRRYFDFLAVDPADPMAVKNLARQVNQGRPLVIFPEGRITVKGSLMKIYDSIAFVAAITEATIVPVWIEGAEFTFTSRLKGIFRRKLFPKITIHVLTPTSIAMPNVTDSSERRYIVGEKLHQIMMESRMASRPKLTLFDALLEAEVRYGAKTPIIKDPTVKELTYRQLLQQILGISCIVEQLSSPKERLGVLLPNAVITVSTLYALSLKNRIPALLNYTVGSQALNCAVTAAEITTIITSRKFLQKGKLTHFVEEVKGVKWIYLEDLKESLTVKNKLWIGFYQFFPRFLKRTAKPDQEAMVLFTSGSEGSPKGVVHTHTSLLANVEQIRSIVDPMPTDRFMSTLPIFHAFGLTVCLLLPLYSGCRVFLYPNPLHYKMVPEIVYDQSCTVLFGTPTFLNNYARNAHPYDFSRLRYVVAGAEKLSESTRELWYKKFGLRILEGYGVTECSPVISLNVPLAFKDRTVGRPLPGIVTRLIPIPGIDQGGRLQIQGPNLMKGYLLADNPGKLVAPSVIDEKGREHKNWYDTGDIVDIDQDGFIIIKGRQKRFAKIGGEMVSLESVEAIAHKVDAEAIHGASIKSDSTKGETIVLFSSSKNISREGLNQAAREMGISTLAVPRDIRIIDQLPLLGTGKVDFVTLQKMAQEG
jgi:acyl-[acyl-carrier-protein]-phospholipid O-acyltransferase / long-chain-fatty-acid--[acyl-carrier-protein] ligase